MKLTILAFISINILSVLSYAQDYYFYEGKRIELTKRQDKIAIILNKTNLTKNNIEQTLKTQINSFGDLKELTENLFLINFSDPVPEAQIDQQISALQTLNELVKFATPVYFGESRKVSQIPTDEFIVKLFNLRDKRKLDDINDQYNIEIKENINDENTFILKSQNGVKLNALQLSEIYLQTGYFEYCEPNFGYPEGCLFNYTPNDAFYTSQWVLNNTGQSTPTGGDAGGGDLTNSVGIPDADMDVNLAWDYTKGNNSVIVGVFDTGVDSAHPDLYQNLITGYDASTNTQSVKTDPVGHGTCTAGIIGARTNNGLGVAGIVGGDNSINSNCKIRSFKLVNSSGVFTTNANLAAAFNLAQTTGVHVSSNSWGGGTPSPTLTTAINNLSASGRGGLGCVILFSSGNDGRNPPAYPSYLASVVCVGASTKHDQKKASGTGNQLWWGGNYGEDANGDLDLVAPTICYTTDIQGAGGYNTSAGTAGDYYATFNGTSAACPNAAGVAALIFSINPNFTRNQVLDYLYRGCEKIDNVGYNSVKSYGYWNEYFGYGRVNALNSVRLSMGVDVTPPSIIHNNIRFHSSTYPTTLTATIVDQNGAAVPNSGSQRPRIYYRFNKNGTGWSSFVPSYTISNVGNVFTFKIPGVGRQTEVQYYIEAQDASGNITTFPKLASTAYPYTLCYYAVGNITTETRSLTTWSPPDGGGGISANVNFPTSFSILEARVRINLSHTWVSDNILIVWSPSSDADNNRKCLFSKNGADGDNITNATVTDSVTQFWRQGTPPYSNGFYKPEYMLTGLNGTNAQGNWKFINYDIAAGDAPTYNSLDIIIRRMNGVTSPCARLNNPADSILYFGNPSPPVVVDRDFYLKNDGNVSLTISAVNFSGTYASMFSLISTLPGSIAQNDSALFRVRLNYSSLLKENQTLGTDAFENALMSISNNDPSKSTFRVSLQTDFALPVELSSFTVKVLKSGGVKLDWRTETEVSNYGFDVEKLQDYNIEKLQDWKNIGFVEGHGNSNSPKDYSFTDNSAGYGKYSYRLKQIDTDGQFEYSKVIEVDAGNIPGGFVLEQNYPNPFNPTTKIKFALAETQSAKLIIYDVLGNEVAIPFNGTAEGGKLYETEFSGENLSSGIYFYRLETKSRTENRKMLLLK
jgi:thermitase